MGSKAAWRVIASTLAALTSPGELRAVQRRTCQRVKRLGGNQKAARWGRRRPPDKGAKPELSLMLSGFAA
jgi:hypothetical protein